MAVTIKTDRKPRDLLYWHDLTAKEQAEFDWLDTEEQREEAQFFRYRGWTYCTDQFMRIENNTDLKDWHGYHGDSYFSGVVVRFTDDGGRVIAGTYYS